jgi:hypothetical protein
VCGGGQDARAAKRKKSGNESRVIYAKKLRQGKTRKEKNDGGKKTLFVSYLRVHVEGVQPPLRRERG